MKELNQKPQTIHEVVMQQEKQQEVELQYLFSLKPHRGHKVWEINTESLAVQEAEYIQERQIEFGTNLEVFPPKKLVIQPGCVYIAALNAKNALKRYEEHKGSTGIKESDMKLGY
jgi:hypothetical protein